MNFGQFLAVVATNALLNRGSTLQWKTVQEWINYNSNPDNLNRGYAMGSLRSGVPGSAFVKIRKEPKGKDSCRVTASVYFDKRQGAAFSKTWEASKLDSELQKMFGKNLRVKISI